MFQQELQDGEDVARCPSCSLIIRVIYDLASQHFVIFACRIICITRDNVVICSHYSANLLLCVDF